MADRLIAALAAAIGDAHRRGIRPPTMTEGAQEESLDALETRARSVPHLVAVPDEERPDERPSLR